MNRFQEVMDATRKLLSEIEAEHRYIGRGYVALLAENKRLKFTSYGNHPRRLQDNLTHCVSKETCFDVTIWEWVVYFGTPASLLP